MSKLQTAAVVTIKSPGLMTKVGRKSIANWLKRTASDLEKLGSRYTENRFIARYYYADKVSSLSHAR